MNEDDPKPRNKPRRIHRKIERTPEELAELRATREKFQRDRPGPSDVNDDALDDLRGQEVAKP